MALAIVGVVAAVVLRTHAFQLRAREALQAGAALPAQAERIFVESHMGTEPDGLAAQLQGEGWRADFVSSAGTGAVQAGDWALWTLAPTGRLSVSMQVELRPTGAP